MLSGYKSTHRMSRLHTRRYNSSKSFLYPIYTNNIRLVFISTKDFSSQFYPFNNFKILQTISSLHPDAVIRVKRITSSLMLSQTA